MPELPEVETVRRGLERHLPGRRLGAVVVRCTDLRWPLPTARLRALSGRRCRAVSRRAKYLEIEFDGPGSPVMLVHLGIPDGCSSPSAGAPA